MAGLSWTHIQVVLGILVFLFGGRKIAELGRGLGEGIRSFRDGLKGQK